MKLWEKGVVRVAFIIVGAVILCAIVFFATTFLPLGKVSYPETATVVEVVASTTEPVPLPPAIPLHIPTPDQVKAVYISSWAAGSEKFREPLFKLIDTTEINAVVIDIKDYTGRISFKVNDPELEKTGAVQNRIPDLKEFIDALHDRDIYVIGRISAFQDSHLVKSHPEWAVKNKAGEVWQDYKGVKWLDAAATPVWEYVARIGKESYAQGFDELNFDYIRFPSDGNMKDIVYSWGEGKTRDQTMRAFFEYINKEFATSSAVISADLFGLTTSSADDLGIGQVLEDALVNFDYVGPMVYPSHFGKGFIGLAKPAEHPYEVIKYSMDKAIDKALAIDVSPLKIRPWLQAFDLGATYTPAMIRAQIQATYDSGLTSWMMWDAASIYDVEPYLPKGASPDVIAPLKTKVIPQIISTSTSATASTTVQAGQ